MYNFIYKVMEKELGVAFSCVLLLVVFLGTVGFMMQLFYCKNCFFFISKISFHCLITRKIL